MGSALATHLIDLAEIIDSDVAKKRIDLEKKKYVVKPR